MLHAYVLFAFVTAVASALIGYGYPGVTFLVIAAFLPISFIRLINDKYFSIGMTMLLVISCVAIHIHIQKEIREQADIRSRSFQYADKTSVSAPGRIAEFPGYRFSNNQYIVELDEVPVRILSFTEPYQKFTYLEPVQFVGQLIDVRKQDEEWQRYYQKLDVQYLVFRANMSSLGTPSPESFIERIKLPLFELKVLIRSLVIQRYSSQASALILGMHLGEKDELSKTEKDLFNQVGLSHILVVSGYNISLLITFIFLVFKFLNRHARIILSLILIFLFVLLVGGDGSVVRAALMGSIIVFAKIRNRPSNALNILLVAVTLMLLYNPFSIFDAGLHLSFIATFSLLILPTFKKIPEFILTTSWVFLFVTPYIAYLSEHVSLAGILSNTLVVLLLPLFMVVSLITFVSFTLGVPFWIDAFVIECMSRYIFWVANMTKHLPRTEINVSAHMAMTVYLVVFVSILFAKNRYSTQEFIEKHYQKFVPQKPS